MKIQPQHFSLLSQGSSQVLFNFPDDEVLNLSYVPNESVRGILRADSGQFAFVEFINDGIELSADGSLPSIYRGEGIYLARPFKKENYSKNDLVPFFIVVRENELTVGKLKEILERVQSILSSRDFLRNKYWSFKDESIFIPLTSYSPRTYAQMVYLQMRDSSARCLGN